MPDRTCIFKYRMYNPNLNLVFTVENQVKGWEIYEANTSYSLMSLLLRLVQILYSRLCSETSRVGSCRGTVQSPGYYAVQWSELCP